MSLDEKLAEFDRRSHQAVAILQAFIETNSDYLIAQARGRLIEGHWRYRDRLMYELSADELLAEASQEIADAINYLSTRQGR